MYAVVSTGGKQYRVEPGSTLIVERLAMDAGASVTFDRVLLVADGDDVTVGTPLVPGASVSATVLAAERGPKIVVFKYKQKVKYRRRTGHRQRLTRVRIDAITANGTERRATEEPETSTGKPTAKRSTPTPRRSAKGAKGAGHSGADDSGADDMAAAATPDAKPRPTRTPRAAGDGGGGAASPRARKPASKPRAARKAAPQE